MPTPAFFTLPPCVYKIDTPFDGHMELLIVQEPSLESPRSALISEIHLVGEFMRRMPQFVVTEYPRPSRKVVILYTQDVQLWDATFYELPN
jgi:hypothetical protein